MSPEFKLDPRVSVSETTVGGVTVYTFTVPANAELTELKVSWSLPMVDIQYQWHPGCGFNRTIQPDWSRKLESKISMHAPVVCLYNDACVNRFTYALSDCVSPVTHHCGVREEDCFAVFEFTVPVTGEATVQLRVDERPIRYEDAIRGVTEWWEGFYPPMPVPDAAKNPMYSAWYSLHQQVYADTVIVECEKAVKLGMDTIIIDDGWQTDDNGRGYAYCGDWKVATGKIPDMAAMVKRIHEIGMKVMVWYSVPFIGIHSEAIKRFEGKTLDFVGLGTYTLDPRYPETREYLIDTYVQALKDWDLDGFKLDFIDSFRVNDKTPPFSDGMDYADLEAAVHRLMVDVMRALRAIRDDILIEFRQRYIGPCMREYGNMFRVGDCPNQTATNRVGVVDLRLTSGNTAVHTDMLEWHPDDRVENAVCQIENGLFATEQISVRMDTVSEAHARAIGFWTGFMREHRDLLQNTPLYADAPQMLYPAVWTTNGKQAIAACYVRDHILRVPKAEEMWLINANSGSRLVLDDIPEGAWKLTVMDCAGNIVREETKEMRGMTALNVPECGLIHMTRA